MNRAVRRRQPRRGTTLVLVAVLFFALLPLMALVLDLGIVRVTRRQMQTSVNTAALEGLRHRDALTELQRREQARDLMNQLPAGPQQYLLDGTGVPLSGKSYRAAPQLMTTGQQLPQVTPYQPNVQLNRDENKQYGDLVAGNYDATAAADPDTLFTEGTVGSGMSLEYYQRNDFEPVEVAAVHEANAFLARLRRTPLYNSNIEPDDEADVSSAGRPVPFVLGRGGLVSGGTPDPHALWNQRERGTTVRATAIADARPAITVGPAIERPGFTAIAGLAPLAITRSFWETFAARPRVMGIRQATLKLNAAGRVVEEIDQSSNTTAGDFGRVIRIAQLDATLSALATSLVVASSAGWQPLDPDNDPQRAFVVQLEDELLRVTDIDGLTWYVTRGVQQTTPDEHPALSRIDLQAPLAVAAALSSAYQSPRASLETAAFSGQWQFVPLYDTIGTQGDRVVGFGWVELSRPETQPELPDLLLVVMKHDSRQIASQNASATRTDAERFAGFSNTEVNAIFSTINNPAFGNVLLKAPALMRTLGKLRQP